MELTKNEKVLKYVSLVYALTFIITALVFILAPGRLLGVINEISADLFPSLPPAGDSGRFWLSLTVSMMATISVLSILIYRDVRNNYRMAVPLVSAKFASSLAGIVYFIVGFSAPDTGWNTLANCVICISDFPLGVLMLVLYILVRNERA